MFNLIADYNTLLFKYILELLHFLLVIMWQTFSVWMIFLATIFVHFQKLHFQFCLKVHGSKNSYYKYINIEEDPVNSIIYNKDTNFYLRQIKQFEVKFIV